MELIKGEYTFHFGDYTIMLLTPKVEWKFGGEGQDIVHISAPTQLLYRRPKNGWQWHRSFVLRVIGLGIGVAHQHCHNPNWKSKKEDCKK